jgi:GDP-mannose 6-dehydrogenase
MEGVSLPVLDNVLNSNQAHLDWLLKMITAKPSRKVGILGLSFKKDTDDLRGSPMVSVAETLLGRGYELHIYDANLNPSRLVGANEAEISRRMPHLAQLLRETPEEVIAECDIIVAAQKVAKPEQLAGSVRKDQWVIDVNGWRDLRSLDWHYEGICW